VPAHEEALGDPVGDGLAEVAGLEALGLRPPGEGGEVDRFVPALTSALTGVGAGL